MTFFSGFSFKDTGDSQDRMECEVTIFLFFSTTNIQTLIRKFACEITTKCF